MIEVFDRDLQGVSITLPASIYQRYQLIHESIAKQNINHSVRKKLKECLPRTESQKKEPHLRDEGIQRYCPDVSWIILVVGTFHKSFRILGALKAVENIHHRLTDSLTRKNTEVFHPHRRRRHRLSNQIG